LALSQENDPPNSRSGNGLFVQVRVISWIVLVVADKNAEPGHPQVKLFETSITLQCVMGIRGRKVYGIDLAAPDPVSSF
jgi:hypothetical protein